MGLDQDIIIRPTDMSLSSYFELKFQNIENPEHWTRLGVTMRKANMIHAWIFDKKGIEDFDDYNAVEIDLSYRFLKDLEAMLEKILNVMSKHGRLTSKEFPDNYVTLTFDTNKPRDKCLVYHEYTKDGEKFECKDIDELPWSYVFDEDTAVILTELMPTCHGFFYGNYEYGADYIYDIVNAYSQLKDAIELAREHSDWKISYLADW